MPAVATSFARSLAPSRLSSFSSAELQGSSHGKMELPSLCDRLGPSLKLSWNNKTASSRVGNESRVAETSRLAVRCMAQPRRVQMVAQQIHREVASMLLNDTTLRAAVQPEHALGADKVMSAIATISDVELSADLQVAKVYVSVYGDERGQAIAMEGLRAKAPYVRSGLGKKMRLRFAPEVRFIQDDSMERGSRVLSILSRLKAEQQARERGEPLPPNLSPIASGGYDDEDEEEELGRAVRAQRKPKKGQGRRWEGDDGVRLEDFGEDEKVFLVE